MRWPRQTTGCTIYVSDAGDLAPGDHNLLPDVYGWNSATPASPPVPVSPLRTHSASGIAPAWSMASPFGSRGLTVGAVFDDLRRGFGAISEIARRHGFETRVLLFEAWSEKQDPLAFLRC